MSRDMLMVRSAGAFDTQLLDLLSLRDIDALLLIQRLVPTASPAALVMLSTVSSTPSNNPSAVTPCLLVTQGVTWEEACLRKVMSPCFEDHCNVGVYMPGPPYYGAGDPELAGCTITSWHASPCISASINTCIVL